MGLVKKQVSEEDRRNFGIDLQSTENTDTGSKVQDPEKKKVILELRERKRKKVSWRYESFFLIYIYINIFHSFNSKHRWERKGNVCKSIF